MEIFFLLLAAVAVLGTVALAIVAGIRGAVAGCIVTAVVIYEVVQHAHK